MAGIDHLTSSPEGGAIARDPQGRYTGILAYALPCPSHGPAAVAAAAAAAPCLRTYANYREHVFRLLLNTMMVLNASDMPACAGKRERHACQTRDVHESGLQCKLAYSGNMLGAAQIFSG